MAKSMQTSAPHFCLLNITLQSWSQYNSTTAFTLLGTAFSQTGVQSVVQFIPMVFRGIEIRNLYRLLKFFHINLGKPGLHDARYVHRGTFQTTVWFKFCGKCLGKAHIEYGYDGQVSTYFGHIQQYSFSPRYSNDANLGCSWAEKVLVKRYVLMLLPLSLKESHKIARWWRSWMLQNVDVYV